MSIERIVNNRIARELNEHNGTLAWTAACVQRMMLQGGRARRALDDAMDDANICVMCGARKCKCCRVCHGDSGMGGACDHCDPSAFVERQCDIAGCAKEAGEFHAHTRQAVCSAHQAKA